MTTVVFDNVTKEFGKEVALREFSLEIRSGELLSIVGPSGSGKTTALRVLAGFETPTSGRIVIGGTDSTHHSAQSRNLGMVFQSYSLFPNMTVVGNIRFALTMRKWPKEDIERRIDQMIHTVHLGKHRDKFPHQLSGGQQQRVALARALASNPPLLLLDEPLSALDAAVREKLRDDIREMQQELSVTTVFVTHDQHEAMAISDRIAVMNEGRLIQLGRPAEVYSHPNSSFVATFMGQMNTLPVKSVNGKWELFGRPLPKGSTGSEGIAYVRPENIRVTPDEAGTGIIDDIVFLGSITRCTIVTPAADIVAEVASPEAAHLVLGSRVTVAVMSEDILIEAVA